MEHSPDAEKYADSIMDTSNLFIPPQFKRNGGVDWAARYLTLDDLVVMKEKYGDCLWESDQLKNTKWIFDVSGFGETAIENLPCPGYLHWNGWVTLPALKEEIRKLLVDAAPHIEGVALDAPVPKLVSTSRRSRPDDMEIFAWVLRTEHQLRGLLRVTFIQMQKFSEEITQFPSDIFTDVTHVMGNQCEYGYQNVQRAFAHLDALARGRVLDMCGTYVPVSWIGQISSQCTNLSVGFKHDSVSDSKDGQPDANYTAFVNQTNQLRGCTPISDVSWRDGHVRYVVPRFHLHEGGLQNIVFRVNFIAPAELLLVILEHVNLEGRPNVNFWFYIPGSKDWTSEQKQQVEEALVRLRERSTANKIVPIYIGRKLTHEEIKNCPRMHFSSDAYFCSAGGDGFGSRYLQIFR